MILGLIHSQDLVGVGALAGEAGAGVLALVAGAGTNLAGEAGVGELAGAGTDLIGAVASDATEDSATVVSTMEDELHIIMPLEDAVLH